MVRILVAEDDMALNRSVCKHLSVHGYDVTGCYDAADALRAWETKKFDLVLSDIMMPHMDGYEFARALRQTDTNVPILFLSARDDFSSKERGFRLGIDDYMTKPIDLNELCLRIEALLRRVRIAAKKQLTVGNLTLDEEAVSAEADGKPVTLTLREFQILYKLLSYPNKTFTRGQLLDEFGGYDSESGLRSVDVHLTNLRQKLVDCTGFTLVTVRGLGYKAVLK